MTSDQLMLPTATTSKTTVIAASNGGVIYRTRLGKTDGLGALVFNSVVILIAAALRSRQGD